MTEDVKKAIAALRESISRGFILVGDVKCSTIAVMLKRLSEELEQVKRERDAAVRDLSAHDHCAICKDYDCRMNDSPCRECLDSKKAWELWQWRGVCAENGGTE